MSGEGAGEELRDPPPRVRSTRLFTRGEEWLLNPRFCVGLEGVRNIVCFFELEVNYGFLWVTPPLLPVHLEGRTASHIPLPAKQIRVCISLDPAAACVHKLAAVSIVQHKPN